MHLACLLFKLCVLRSWKPNHYNYFALYSSFLFCLYIGFGTFKKMFSLPLFPYKSLLYVCKCDSKFSGEGSWHVHCSMHVQFGKPRNSPTENNCSSKSAWTLRPIITVPVINTMPPIIIIIEHPIITVNIPSNQYCTINVCIYISSC